MSRTGVARGRYTFESEGVPTGRGLQGMHILRNGSGCQIWKPTWGGKKTIVRTLPVRDPDNPNQWDPFRLSDGPHGFGDWIRRYDMAFSIGIPGITFITQDPRDHDIDAQQNPVWMLHRAIPAAVRSGQAPSSWGAMVVGQTGRPLPISPPKDGYLMQGIVVEWNDKPRVPPIGVQPNDMPVVFLMSQTAGEALIEKIQEKNPDGSWKHPDLLDFNGGGFIQFHQAGSQNRVNPAQTGSLGSQQRALGGQALENRYEVEILDNYNNVSPAITDLEPMLAARSQRVMWDEIIHIPTLEEQVQRLSRCGLPASAIVYALGEAYRDLIPEDVQAAARNETARVSVPFQSLAGSQFQPAQQQPAQQQPAQQQPAQQQPARQQPAQQQPVQQQPVQQQPVQQQPAQGACSLGQMVGTPPPGPPAVQSNNPGAAQTEPFEPQPTHESSARQNETMAAIEQARLRAAGHGQQQQQQQ